MQTKTEAFTATDLRAAELAKALGHPARIAILRTLAERRSCVCGEIVEVLPLAQSTVSQHLAALKEAGLIQGIIEGPRSCYCLDPAGMREVQVRFFSLFAQLLVPEDTAACTPTDTNDKCC
jgi:DNA-binding transcriptional ArsR family regulator